MGSGAPNKGYAEMWGGTVKTFPHELRPLAPGASQVWTEWMYPYQRTGGLTYANQHAALTCLLSADGSKLDIAVCPPRSLENAVMLLRIDGRTEMRQPFSAAPDAPYQTSIALAEATVPENVVLSIERLGTELVRCRAVAEVLRF